MRFIQLPEGVYAEGEVGVVGDTLQFGGRRKPPPRWVWAIVAMAAAAAVAVAGVVVNRGRPQGAATSSPSTSPSPVTTSVASSAAPATGSAARWPSTAGRCGSDVYLPQIRLTRHYTAVNATVLVGGTTLGQISVGRTTLRPLAGLPRGRLVTKLVAGPDADYAFVTSSSCGGTLRIYRIVARAAHRLNTIAFDLLGGPHHAWAVSFPPYTALTPLNGGRTVRLRTGTDPVAATAAGLVVVAHDRRAGRVDTVELVDPNSGALLRRLAKGSPLGATDGAVLVSLPDCGPPLRHGTCSLEGVDLKTGRPTGTYELPIGRVPVSDAVFSPDGAVAAFQLTRARQDPRFTTGPPFPPADVVVLHLDTGRLDVVPGLELPPGAGAGLAFDATGSSLLATVSEGSRGELLVWRRGMPGPALVTSLPGPLMAAPPLLPLSSSGNGNG